jgi:hypothetical protein
MNEAAITHYIISTFNGVTTVTADGNTFFFYDPEQKFPFATLVTNDDAYEQVSNLSRPGIFRLNIGVGKQTYQSLFGEQTATSDLGEGRYDFTALDQLLPHPVYGRMYWVCVLNPSLETFDTTIRPLLAEAYERDIKKHAKRARRGAKARGNS